MPQRGTPDVKRRALLAFALFTACAPVQAEGFTATPWQEASGARVRLIMPDAPKGVAIGAIEIILPPGSKTYWRTPGDTGVPTMADFTGSTGTGDIALLFPAPVAFDDGVGGLAYGYRDRVTFPVTFIAETAHPKLAVGLSFGICTKSLCLPAQATLTLAAGAGQNEGSLAGAVGAARGTVPRAQPLGADAPLSIAEATLSGSADAAALIVRARVPSGVQPTLFAEGEAAMTTRLTGQTGDMAEFAVRAEGAAMPARGPLVLTLVAGSAAIETKLDLDGLKKAP